MLMLMLYYFNILENSESTQRLQGLVWSAEELLVVITVSQQSGSGTTVTGSTSVVRITVSSCFLPGSWISVIIKVYQWLP